MIDQARETLAKLASMQYTRNDMVLHRGNFRARGDTIDVFPAEHENDAIRIHLFDDEIYLFLERFDPLTGSILSNVVRFTIYPKTHYVTPRETINITLSSIKDINKSSDGAKEQNKFLEYQRLDQRTQYDLEMMQELGYCTGIENYSRHLSGRLPGEPPPTLLDYLSKDALIFIDESHVTLPQIRGMFRGDRSRKKL